MERFRAQGEPGLARLLSMLRRAAAAALAATLLAPTLVLVLPALPYTDGQVHEGVATCAGAACHGAATPHQDSPILQNEYYIWTREDRHSQAYKTLLSAESRRMGQLLGLTPHQSPRCLSCHSDFVPEAQRGRRFRLSDGVGCEACHGGSERWLESHVERDATHADNLAAGLYPTEEPAARARMCLSCHLGGPDHPIDHEIMGAGHPPLGFELDTFTAIEPAHHDLDADYAARKGIRSSLQTWADGQLVAARRYLEELAGPRLRDGTFPELVFFDCYACHHEMTDTRWDRGPAPGLAPGRVRLHGVNLLLVHTLLRQVDERAANAWGTGLRELHAASQRSVDALQTQAGNLAAQTGDLESSLAGRSYSEAEAWALLEAVSQQALASADYNLAEQTTMALEAIFLTLDRAGKVSGNRSSRMRAAIDEAYKYTNDAKDYRAGAYNAALRQFRGALP